MSKGKLKTITWEATHIRFSLFLESPYTGKGEDLLSKLSGIEIEKTTNRPPKNETIIDGVYKDHSIRLIVSPTRIELGWRVPNTFFKQPPTDSKIPVIGEHRAVTRDFLEVVAQWIKDLPITNFARVAYGTELLFQIETLEEGYKLYSELLSIPLNAKEDSDFRFMINKRTSYKEGQREVLINRLSTWDIPQLSIEMGNIGNPEPTYTFPEIKYCHLLLDINTVPNQGVLTKDEIVNIFNKLVDFGVEISEKGVK